MLEAHGANLSRAVHQVPFAQRLSPARTSRERVRRGTRTIGLSLLQAINQKSVH